ncbi:MULTISPECIES: retropepsin-like aspartic protease family protein [Methylomicrobium]|uniref:Clan AA aspartic protease, TIGR02281 family n=1 Tax=Methylomicrobium album BG8 TaxID=686340 RepID=H8GRF0_METAL|nr:MULTISPECIES: retropepsin-like aspartic protease [Methylomicrobium]EIC31129.1 clan AA aspartic protease, TIGR02281 family [Methylomicrobium album BG8]
MTRSFYLHPIRKLACALCVAVALNAKAQEADSGQDLYGQLESLQNQMHIQIVGLDNIGDEPKARARGSLEQRLEKALSSYNHAITRDTQGKIEKVVIINKKQKTDSGRIVLPARFEGGHFIVSLAVSGRGDYWEPLEMIVDTGADLMVLPASMIAKLGMDETALAPRIMQTANGNVDAKVGKLRGVRIEGEHLENVEAAFVDDELLNHQSLLGMSALGRYKLMIDNESRLVTLIRK